MKKDVNPIDTDASVSLALKQISNAFVKDANRTLKRIGLTVSQAEILLFLYHTPDSGGQRDIESHFGLQHPTVIGLLERLRKKGFVQCAVNPEDRRCRTVSLTEKAYEIQQEMELRRKKDGAALAPRYSGHAFDPFAGNAESNARQYIRRGSC